MNPSRDHDNTSAQDDALGYDNGRVVAMSSWRAASVSAAAELAQKSASDNNKSKGSNSTEWKKDPRPQASGGIPVLEEKSAMFQQQPGGETATAWTTPLLSNKRSALHLETPPAPPKRPRRFFRHSSGRIGDLLCASANMPYLPLLAVMPLGREADEGGITQQIVLPRLAPRYNSPWLAPFSASSAELPPPIITLKGISGAPLV